jgi:hypothetical protein
VGKARECYLMREAVDATNAKQSHIFEGQGRLAV